MNVEDTGVDEKSSLLHSRTEMQDDGISQFDSGVLETNEEIDVEEEGTSNSVVVCDQFLLKKETEAQKRKIERALDTVMRTPNGGPIFGEERPGYESSATVYAPSYEQDEFETNIWSHAGRFLTKFDDVVFNQSVSYKTRFLQVILGLIGVLPPAAWGPLTIYLSSGLFWELPEQVNWGIVAVIMLVCIPPCVEQMVERAGDIGNWLFDHNGLKPSKHDKFPHKTKLTKQIETPFRFRGSILYIPIPIEFGCSLGAIVYSTIQTSPFVLLFLSAEDEFKYMYTFAASLGIMVFEKYYREGKESLKYLAHQYFTNYYPMQGKKKDILRTRLKDMRFLVNRKGSKALNLLLYREIRRSIMNLNNPAERVSALSLLFLRPTPNPRYTSIKEMIDGYVPLRSDSLIGPRSFVSSAIEMDRIQDLEEIVSEVKPLRFIESLRLNEDITQLPGITSARRTYEHLSAYIPGAAIVGRFLIPMWTVPEIFDFFEASLVISGVEINPLYIGIAVSTFLTVIRVPCEFKLQKDAFLNYRRIGSRSNDTWGLRWLGNGISFIPAVAIALSYPSIIFDLLGEKTPIYLKIILSVFTFVPEFNSFYSFFSDKYNKLITRVVRTFSHCSTIGIRTEINTWIDYLLNLIHELDGPTTDQAYNLTQGGL